jgi:hypothetical protein
VHQKPRPSRAWGTRRGNGCVNACGVNEGRAHGTPCRPDPGPDALVEQSDARQAADDSLQWMAMSIHGRAVQRAGQLFREIPPAQGANQNIRDGADPKVLTRKSAAEAAGMSERQRKTACLTLAPCSKVRASRLPGTAPRARPPLYQAPRTGNRGNAPARVVGALVERLRARAGFPRGALTAHLRTTHRNKTAAIYKQPQHTKQGKSLFLAVFLCCGLLRFPVLW